MKLKQTGSNQLVAIKKPCKSCGAPTLFKSSVLPGMRICDSCEPIVREEKAFHDAHMRNKRSKTSTKSRNRRGSNQYRTKTHYKYEQPVMLVILIILLGVLVYAAISGLLNTKPAVTEANASYISPVATASATPTPTVTVEPSGDVADMIRKTFGIHADKAFALLACENATLNPRAVNTAGNVPAGSRDIGVFQINSYWQGVHEKFLFDPQTNVQLAWQIYRDSGYSFKMWSCGKRLGI